MAYRNQTLVTEFFFMGLTNHFQYQVVLFLVFLFVYLVTLLGNLGMITLIWLDSRLHTPMYFFLSHLSFVDVCSSSVTGPKMLTDIFTEKKVCVQLVVGPYAMGLISTLTHTTFAFHLPYCGPNIINHFFCDLLPVLSLACADIHVNKFLLFTLAGALGVLSGVIILVSYIYILIAILRIHSADGRRKAFSTCSSHLTAVSILYGTLFFIYVRPSSSFSLDINKVVSLFYTSVIPMLNPLIYSLRNKDVKDSFRRKIERKKFLRGR
ncbi:PREDICTED: olfactory receptor 1002-like [Propithecus coquereli]|uniref:olfactory receptor 1002-like n=1 Tax=Propithecus coquereli TaxID=379532 RepID=UPI00063F843F|nr:PREDICTED: olfactory receptor 1002-like [Propithecus coquereli]